MRVVIPEEDGETEPEANPQHAEGDEEEARPLVAVTDEPEDGGGEVEGGAVSVDVGGGPWTGGKIEGSLHQVLDDALLGDGDGPGPEGIAPWASISLSYTAKDGQEVRLELDQNVGAEDFEAGLETFERTVRYLVGSAAVTADPAPWA